MSEAREVERSPFQAKRNTVPDREIERCEEADEEGEVDDGAAELHGVGCPAVGEGCDDGDGVYDGGIGVDLRDGVLMEGFQPEIHVAADILAADEEGVVCSVDPEVPFSEDSSNAGPGERYILSLSFIYHPLSSQLLLLLCQPTHSTVTWKIRKRVVCCKGISNDF